MLARRRSRYIVILIASLPGSAISYIHMRGVGLVGGRIVNSSGKFFWVWTLLPIGVTTIFSVLLSARGLWNLHRRQRVR